MSSPVNPQLSEADDELLSAYIDNELDATERASLEARLEREPVLRATLDDLRATVGLLRELPQFTPPRSFTLDPAAHRPRWLAWSAWLWRGSALAAMLLALTFTLDFVGTNGAPTMSSAPLAAPSSGGAAGAAEFGATSAPAAAAATSAPDVALVAPGAPAATPATGASSATEPTVAAKVPASQTELGPASSTTDGAATAAPAAGAELAAQPTDEASADSAANSTAAQSAPAADLGTGSAAAESARAANPPDTSALTQNDGIAASGSSSPGTEELNPPSAAPTQPQIGPVQNTQRGIAPLRAVQAALGALVVLLAGAALWLTRRRV